MKNKIFATIFLICTKFLFAQDVITIDTIVLETNTNIPISYANIGFIKKSIGTVSDVNGRFVLEYYEDYIGSSEILQISSLGYETLNIESSELFKILSNTNKIYLKPKNLDLDQVIITAKQTEKTEVGSLAYDGYSIGYWKDQIALGAEMATKIKIKKKGSKLLDLKIRILENLSDSLKLRVNIYSIKGHLPYKNILNKNVFYTVNKKKGIDTINLKPYKIKLDDDVIVSLELVEVYGGKVGFALAGKNKKGTTYTRYISQDKWKKVANVGMSYSLLTSFPKRFENKTLNQRDEPKEISLFWDTSASMQINRDIDTELDFLEKYLKKLKNTSIQVSKFSSSIVSRKNFKIVNGNSFELMEHLKATKYEGGTDFSKIVLDTNFNAESILLFTDGITTLSELKEFVDLINTPVFCISSSRNNADHNALQNISLNTGGHYINLKKADAKTAIEAILFVTEDNNFYEDSNDYGDLKDNVYGKVHDIFGPVQGVLIKKKGSFIETITDSNGLYSISAKFNDVLVVSYLGVKTKEIPVLQLKNIDVKLEFDGELLKEVNIKTQNLDEKAKKQIKNRKYGFASSYLGEEDINSAAIYLTDVLKMMPGVVVTGSGTNAKVFLRDRSTSPALIVDGIQSNNYLSVNPQNIHEIIILRSLAATNRFGSYAAGGAILVNTKTAVNRDAKGNIINTALLTDNDYNETKLLKSTNSKSSKYVQELSMAGSLQEALKIYNNQKANITQESIPFYVDASDYFLSWDEGIALNILTSIADIAFDNPTALKTLAYKLEALNKPNEAEFIYKRILELRPKQIQSYRDVAQAYQKTGDYNNAMLLYKQMVANAIEELDFSSLSDVLVSEIQHLVKVHRTKVDYKDLSSDLLRTDFKKDIRLVFEWNNPLADFELQFVNPQKKFFKWEHSSFSKKEIILDEIEKGYNIKEFFIDDAEEGEWIINIKSLNKENLLNPTYLKYTVYKNYAEPDETSFVKVIKLYAEQEKVTLDRFMYKEKANNE